MATMNMFTFRRPETAIQLADAVMGRALFSFTSGLFLAAPRRTGKSTFLRQDLVPLLEERGVVTIYVDLWENRQEDPADLIFEAVKSVLRDLESGALAALRDSGVSRISVGRFITVDIDQVGEPGGATLTAALRHLFYKSGRPIALVIDEAQHAMATEKGHNVMFALKAARDALTQERHDPADPAPPLMLICTGSHRDKLAHLVMRRDQPFFGADITDFPLLGRDYTDAYTAWLNQRLAEDNRFDPDDVYEAFKILGHRPEMLQNVLKDMAFSVDKAGALKKSLAEGATNLRARLWEDYEREYDALTDVQRAVLSLLIETGNGFSPFNSGALERYAEAVGEPVTARDAQTALEGLRQRNIVWRSARGTYALEDQGMAEWFRVRHTSPISK